MTDEQILMWSEQCAEMPPPLLELLRRVLMDPASPERFELLREINVALAGQRVGARTKEAKVSPILPELPRGPRDQVIQVRVSDGEKEAMAAAAELAGLSVSEWARSRLREVARRELAATANR